MPLTTGAFLFFFYHLLLVILQSNVYYLELQGFLKVVWITGALVRRTSELNTCLLQLVICSRSLIHSPFTTT